jgi:LCP family protein required for cell wall assembly
VSHVRDEQMGGSRGRPLPPRLDPRAGRPAKPRGGDSGGASRRSSAREDVRERPRPSARPRAGATAAPVGPPPRFGRVLGLTTLGALLPGSAFLAAGARRLGWMFLGASAVAVAIAAWLATAGRKTAVQLAVDPTFLLVVIAGAVAVAVVWSLVVIAGYRMLAPDSTTRGQHLVGGALVTLLALAVAAPAFEVAHLASVQRNLITGLFSDDGQSATVPDTVAADPWGSKDRVNVLLLGGDGGDDRTGVRTDTVMVASIDTETGVTTMFSLPRNLEDLPFPEDSPLADLYPDGFDAGSEAESLLNAVYRNGPAEHPDVLGPTDYPGADFLKLGVGEALGLHIDYFVMVNLDGFSALVDALGGIRVNVNYWVPIGGDPGTGALPNDYISPGPDQLFMGDTALSYARGRFGLSDYQRMDRQRCVISAIVDAADPVTLLSKYQELAATTQDIVLTDIPQSVVGDFVGLALKVKDAGITSVVFDDSVITPAYPDYDLIREHVQDAIGSAAAPAPGASGFGSDSGSDSAAGSDAGAGTAAPAPSGGSESSSGSEGSAGDGGSAAATESPAVDVADACAYDAERAQEEMDKGEPPTRRR